MPNLLSKFEKKELIYKIRRQKYGGGEFRLRMLYIGFVVLKKRIIYAIMWVKKGAL